MAVALAGGFPVTSTITTASSVTITKSITVASGANRLLVAMVAIGRSTTSVSTMVYNGSESFIKAGRVTGASLSSAEAWYLVNPTATTANVVITPASGNASWYWAAEIYSFTGAGAVTFAGKGAATATISDTVAGFVSGDYVVDIVCVNNTGHTLAVTGNNVVDHATIDLGLANDQDMAASHNVTDGVMSWSGLASDDSSHAVARVAQFADTGRAPLAELPGRSWMR